MLTIIVFCFFNRVLFSQTDSKIKIKKEAKTVLIDSAKFDFEAFALTNIYLGFKDRYRTIDHFTINYSSRKKSGHLLIKGNYLPKTFKKQILNMKTRKIILEFSNIVLKEDSLNPNLEYQSPNFKYEIKKKISFTRSIASFAIFWPFPTYSIIN